MILWQQAQKRLMHKLIPQTPLSTSALFHRRKQVATGKRHSFLSYINFPTHAGNFKITGYIPLWIAQVESNETQTMLILGNIF